MPRYTFECVDCHTRFTKSLKMGDHPSYGCPECGSEAPRLWNGESFGFDFSVEGNSPGNSGVTKHDYPSADQAVGRSSEVRWQEIRARDAVKEKVREKGGTHALIRRNGTDYIEYEAGGETVIKRRRNLVKMGNEIPEKVAQ